jgi:LPS export ABC transporter protein LptC
MFLHNILKRDITKKKTKFVLVSILFLAAVLGGGMVFFSLNKPNPETVLKILPDNVDLQIRNFHYTEVGDENWKWEIDADTAEYVKKDNLAYFDNVKMRIIDSNGKIITLTGKKGRLNTETKSALISGNVLVETENGDQIRTENLNFADAEKKVFTGDPVEFTNGRLTIKGIGLTFLIPEQKVTLHDRVDALLKQ